MSYGLASVTVEYGETTALDAVDLPVGDGAITAVIGADGAGKTTTARTLVGLASPSSGEVSRPPWDQIGYQPEGAGTWRDLTVSENLAFVASAHGLPARSERERHLLEVTGLATTSDRLAGALSGGMRQKLAVAMAVLPRPRLTVLDEPTTGLDPVSRAEVWRLLGRAAGEGTAVLATTTYLDEAERAAHVVVLDGGRVLAAGTARSIRESFRGALGLSRTHLEGIASWRRGRYWRVWSPRGELPPGVEPIQPDLEDVVVAAALIDKGST
jgi:ABC-2 type transport system ATP-binding protein